MPEKESALAEQLLRQTAHAQKMMQCKGFFSYAYKSFTEAPLYSRWQSLLAYIRKFRMIAWILRIVALLFALLQAGVWALLLSALLLILLPSALLLCLISLLAAQLDSRRANRKMQALLQGKAIYILFLPIL